MHKTFLLFSLLLFPLLVLSVPYKTFAQVIPPNCGQMDGMAMPTCAPTPSQSTSPQQMVPPPQTATIVRKNIYTLTPDELSRFINAINIVRANGSYQRLMNEHMQAMMTLTANNEQFSLRNAAHRGPIFLPWHREFLAEFEQLLRTVDPSVSVPYWAFENENQGTLPMVFSSTYFGGDGNPAQGDRVTDGPFATWGIIRRVGRETADGGQTALPNANDVAALMNITTYDAPPYDELSSGFRNAIEGWAGINNAPWGFHNRVHGYVGGDMLPNDAMTTNPVNDPIFWLVHANIDRIWWQWQQQHGITNYSPNVGGPAGHNLNDVMQFLQNGRTAANVLDINSMGYTYN